MKWVLLVFILFSQIYAKQIIIDNRLEYNEVKSFVDGMLKKNEKEFKKQRDKQENIRLYNNMSYSKFGYSLQWGYVDKEHYLPYAFTAMLFKTTNFYNLGFQGFIRDNSEDELLDKYKHKVIGIGINYQIKKNFIVMISKISASEYVDASGYDIGVLYLLKKLVGFSINYDSITKQPNVGMVMYW